MGCSYTFCSWSDENCVVTGFTSMFVLVHLVLAKKLHSEKLNLILVTLYYIFLCIPSTFSLRLIHAWPYFIHFNVSTDITNHTFSTLILHCHTPISGFLPPRSNHSVCSKFKVPPRILLLSLFSLPAPKYLCTWYINIHVPRNTHTHTGRRKIPGYFSILE